jgi:signal transduction histidine kinase
MAFKFAARTLLELGKELISSDEVAIYELIKNSIDAKSPVVEIDFNICLLKSDFDKAIFTLQKNKDYESARDFAVSQLQTKATSDSLNRFKRILDRAEDSKSFEKALVKAYATCNWIEVKDVGSGMTLEDLDLVYLTVGTRSKRKLNLEGAQNLGDKGVGRLSTMRLGEQVKVTTSVIGEKNFNVLDIDWTLFGHDIEGEVGDISIDPFKGLPKPSSNEHGTNVHISKLNSDWREARVIEMLNGAIARMVDPFEQGRGNQLLHVTYNATRLPVPSVPTLLLRSAHASCKAKLEFDEDGIPVFSGSIDYSYKKTKSDFNQSGAELYSITQKVYKKRGKRGHAANEIAAIRPEAIKELGPFEVEIYWYNRQSVESITDLTNKSTDTKELIAAWSGGLMLYRNGFRVLPYGEPDDDWLELDKRAFGGSGFLLNRQQLLGRVTVHSAHTALSEQTNREGLIQSESSDALIAIMMWLMHIEFRSVIRKANLQDRELRKEEQKESLLDFKTKQFELQSNLDSLYKKIPDSAYPSFNRVKNSIDEIVKSCDVAVEAAQKALTSVVHDREQFVYLAGIGLMTEFIFHELDRAIANTSTSLVSTLKRHPGDASLSSLEQQLVTLQKRVSAFDEMTGEKRQTKSRFDVAEVVKTVIASHKKEFERHGIQCEFEPKFMELRAVKGMLIQIIENLVGNATYWLKQQVRVEEDFRPILNITINPISKSLEISDNGPGVSPERRERIFEAFVTSKPPGQGRGLGLYICRELAVYHDWSLSMSNEIGEYRSGRLNTFVLDFKG